MPTVQQALTDLVNLEKELDAIQPNSALFNYDLLLQIEAALKAALGEGSIKKKCIADLAASIQLRIDTLFGHLETQTSPMLQAASKQLAILSKYAASHQDKAELQKLSKHIDSLTNPRTFGRDFFEPLNEGLQKIESIRFEGKGGTEAERTCLSAFSAILLSFIRNVINFLTCHYFENDLYAMPKTAAETRVIEEQLVELSKTQEKIDALIERLPTPKPQEEVSDRKELSFFSWISLSKNNADACTQDPAEALRI